MAEGKSRQGGGGKLSRTETVTVRLDPRLRYVAELAARKQRRTLSSFIEWAIEESLCRTVVYDGSGTHGDDSKNFAEVVGDLWDVDESERFARLAILYPELLTHDEQIIWRIIRDCLVLVPARKRSGGYDWDKLESHVFPRLRELWPHLMMVWNEPPSALNPWIQREKEVSIALQEQSDNQDDNSPL